MLRYVFVPQVPQLWNLQIITLLTTVKQWDPLHLKHLCLPDTALQLSRESAKASPAGGTLYSGTIYLSTTSTLLNVIQSSAKSFHLLYVKHIMVDGSKVQLAASIIRRLAQLHVNDISEILAAPEPVCLFVDSRIHSY